MPKTSRLYYTMFSLGGAFECTARKQTFTLILSGIHTYTTFPEKQDKLYLESLQHTYKILRKSNVRMYVLMILDYKTW